jgi:hypothetical protein
MIRASAQIVDDDKVYNADAAGYATYGGNTVTIVRAWFTVFVMYNRSINRRCLLDVVSLVQH